ncbi:MAG: hypothetical protein DRI56_12200 [Chloroflexota bacterium]|nr:MAG: hypothetical protein DRI56_12200 [Chloroflexota bacterium]
MKPIEKMNQAELAAYVQNHLRKAGIEVVLSGGAAVGIYTNGEYVSKDIDLVNARFADRRNIEKAMLEIGFNSIGRHFENPSSKHLVEFPPGPLFLGDGKVNEISELKFNTGILRVLSPTDCVKDRLAHYYHWGDRQCLTQAILVAEKNNINISDIQEWSKTEGKAVEFEEIRSALEKD